MDASNFLRSFSPVIFQNHRMFELSIFVLPRNNCPLWRKRTIVGQEKDPLFGKSDNDSNQNPHQEPDLSDIAQHHRGIRP
jgi:hypothetical protein